MGPASARPRRTCIRWQGLLLTASLFTFWNPPTAAQPSIEAVPPLVAEGKEVLLLAHNVSQDLFGYNWYKGERVAANYRIIGYRIESQVSTTGPAYSGRETLYPNGSLLVQSVTPNDTGSYTLHLIDRNITGEEVLGRFDVQAAPPKPYITSNNFNPIENKDVVALTCEPETQNTTYLWWVNNQSLPVSSRLVLSSDNRTLVLISVTRNDTGPYECEIQNTLSASRSDPVTLLVRLPDSSPVLSAGTTVSMMTGVLAAMALIAALA
ncbi:carcinoembryonic antigen-related cell adhesion molecule 7 [Aotus nancymaae]|uniref:CEA cell adhesion molecule 7 n=1 Tax=Aotus nancymaae TaxID=37293 RepID=A0A2K5CSI2_AOTNA|nr:carcinoembryonic antigen-related cell adhesion molecule 7 [Aotus nancymaae]XP_012316946.1 carcinoembryonic antigen-related cell adhesion molecule 7 [Aotus nancymaae]XP_012316948.1 carcinoembryonic antigen-related cell adhesion molecule 7 [Aotus nancymaae]XP_021526085.1 carcinoembryonic antigen-related cell adhesion molecule 7 [Aotus nancymaae]XP_021526086.1 carcinoembryonic antigen-related cell adhesion molecule 7 [Aotus nancymaae]XP_021526087.1 carcinoembryonic antigen-related cell adhesio